MKLKGAPFCSEKDFADAIAVIEESKMRDVVLGLVKPAYAPGGYYGQCWWSLDYALACEGVKWYDFETARDLIHNLRATQCEDGRIKLYGIDNFNHIPNVQEPISSLPKYFETCYAIACMSGDPELCRETLELFERSISWWVEKRLDRETGLFTAVFEESFIANTESSSGRYAPVDTNIQLAIGMENTARLMRILGENGAEDYENMAVSVKEAVQKWLWNDEAKAYFPIVLPEKKQYPALMGSTFMGMNGAPEDRCRHMETLLKNNDRFGWEETPITSVAKDDPLFVIITGDYCGNPSWSGSIWSMINEQTVRALQAAGRQETACQLAVKTAEAFAGNYAEFLHPFTRSGEGVHRYAWTAAQCVRLVVEVIFGVSYDGFAKTITAAPLFCPELQNVRMTLMDLDLPDGRKADVAVCNGQVEITLHE